MDVTDDFSGSFNDLTDVPPASAHYTDDSIDGTEAAFIGWDMDVSDDFDGDYGSLTNAPAQLGDLGGNMTEPPLRTSPCRSLRGWYGCS